MTADILTIPGCVNSCSNPNCSHLFWYCTSCDEKNGYGLSKEILEEQIEQHNNAECPTIYEHG